MDPDHFGLSLPVALDGIPDALLASIRRRRPDTDPAALVAAGWDGARRMIGQYVEAGLSKFVSATGQGPGRSGRSRSLVGAHAATELTTERAAACGAVR